MSRDPLLFPNKVLLWNMKLDRSKAQIHTETEAGKRKASSKRGDQRGLPHTTVAGGSTLTIG